MKFLSNSMIGVGRISNLDGNKFLHSFIIQDNKVYDYCEDDMFAYNWNALKQILQVIEECKENNEN